MSNEDQQPKSARDQTNSIPTRFEMKMPFPDTGPAEMKSPAPAANEEPGNEGDLTREESNADSRSSQSFDRGNTLPCFPRYEIPALSELRRLVRGHGGKDGPRVVQMIRSESQEHEATQFEEGGES